MTEYLENTFENAPSNFRRFIFNKSNGLIEIRAVNKQNGDVKQYFLEFKDELPKKELEDLNSTGYEIYVGIATRKMQNGKKESAYEIPALWVDIDTDSKTDKYEKLREIESLTERIRLQPSMIIDSGNGFQLYFLLDSNYEIKSPDDIKFIEGKLKWLASELNGDHVTDVSRVMRLPGFCNMKDLNDPKSCFIYYVCGHFEYGIDKFKSVNINETLLDKITLGEIPNELPTRFFELIKSDDQLKNTWQGEREDLPNASGSELDMALASKLVRREFSNEEISRILMESLYKKKNPRTTAYLEHTLSKARSNYESSKDTQFKVPTIHKGLSGISLKPNDFEDTNIQYLIDNFLPQNTLMLMTGSYGAGKSYFCLALAKKLIGEGHTVVIADLDMPKHIIRGRLEDSGLLEHLGAKLHYIHSTNFPFKIDARNQNWQEFKQLIEAENGAIVIFDNLKELYPVGEDLNDDRRAIAVMNELKDIRDMLNTVILLHHVSKDGSSKHPFKNSGSIADSVDVAYVLERTDNECRLRSFKSRIPVKQNVKFMLDSDFSLQTKETEQEKDDMDKMLMIYEYMRDAYDGLNGFLQREVVEDLAGKISRDKVRDTLLMGEDILWSKTPGNKNSHIYKPIELNAQNSKKVPIYTLKKLGILESEEDIATIQEESPLESQLGENLRS